MQPCLIIAPIPQVRDWPCYGKVMQQYGIARMAHPGQKADLSQPTASDYLESTYRVAEAEFASRLNAMTECKGVMLKLQKDIDALSEAYPCVAAKLLRKELGVDNDES